MASRIPLLPLVRAITRWNKGSVEDAACQCVLHHLKARHPGLDISPFVSSEAACTIAALLLQGVHKHFRIGKLRRMGFDEDLIQATEKRVSYFPTQVHLTCKRVPVSFAHVRTKPFIMVSGLPVDCKSREVRAVAMLFTGYLGFAEMQPKGMLVVFIWWTSPDHASSATHRLIKTSLDPSCLCAPDVQYYPSWPAGLVPPEIHY